MPLKRFLIVDDDERFGLLVAKQLEPYGQPLITLSGEDALLQFEHYLREKAAFTAVFMDIKMPDMDGHTVVEKMRKLEESYNIPPISAFKLVMLTGCKDISNVSKAFFHGNADAYVPKEEFGKKFLPELKNISLV